MNYRSPRIWRQHDISEIIDCNRIVEEINVCSREETCIITTHSHLVTYLRQAQPMFQLSFCVLHYRSERNYKQRSAYEATGQKQKHNHRSSGNQATEGSIDRQVVYATSSKSHRPIVKGYVTILMRGIVLI